MMACRHVFRMMKSSINIPVTNGVKQGCVMASTLSLTMLFAMLSDTFQDCDTDLPISYRFDGRLFNVRRQ